MQLWETFFLLFFIAWNNLIHKAYCNDIQNIMKEDPTYGKTWMYFPDGKNNPQIIDIKPEDTNLKFTLAHENPDEKIKLWYFNKKLGSQPIYLKETGNNSRTNFTLTKAFEGNRRTKIIIHGWKNNLNSDVIQMLTRAYLASNEDLNIVAVDWGDMAQDNNYLSSAASTRNVGRNVAEVINAMVVRKGAKRKDIHIIGHSLGGHTAGFAGMFYYHKTGKKIGRITDPAYPAFRDSSKTNETLDPSDAEFVDVIHTCSGMLGHNENLGDADFYPNNGQRSQPGCNFQSDLIGGCSHGRSYQYFAESIRTKNGFMSFGCNSFVEYENKDCDGDPIPMGEFVPKSARGTFFLQTSAEPPFSRSVKIF